MIFLVGIFTVLIVLACILLILLVLIQLPKKDAGAGLAFGSGTADALFGAGSGNALTKITKWVTAIFFVFALGLGYMEDHLGKSDSSSFEKQVQQNQSQQDAIKQTPLPTQPAVTPTNNLLTPAPTATTNPSAAPVQSK